MLAALGIRWPWGSATEPAGAVGGSTTPPNEPEDRSASESASTSGGITSSSSSPPKCFRIENVPLVWSKDDLLRFLREEFKSPFEQSNSQQLSLHPACCGSSQTALLNLRNYPGSFRSPKPIYQAVHTENGSTHLKIDSLFYDLTPLNTPEEDIVADVVAVTGLAGHAFGSWRSRETHQMWLKDFLPNRFKNIRIMSYGYDSTLIGNKLSESRLSDYRRNFIQLLINARSAVKNRPIIFFGHSLGGILVLQTLLDSKQNHHYEHIFNSVHAIFLFGTPHSGLNTTELEKMVEDESGDDSKRILLMQLREGSEFLENQKEALSHVWGGINKIVTFFEAEKTPTVKKSDLGNYERIGKEVEMVGRFSAVLHLPNEHRNLVEKNHTDMVKFAYEGDKTYQMVVMHMGECVGDILQSREKGCKDVEYERTKEFSDCFKSLKPSDFKSYRDNLFTKRHGDTCEWFFED